MPQYFSEDSSIRAIALRKDRNSMALLSSDGTGEESNKAFSPPQERIKRSEGGVCLTDISMIKQYSSWQFSA